MLKLKSFNFEQQQFQDFELEQSYPGQVAWILGRNTNCDLVLPNPDVSRVHGRIFYSGNCYYFVDIGSSSGTLLNGETLETNEKQPLCPGDLLQIGETFMYVESLSPPSGSVNPAIAVPPRSLLPEKLWTTEDITCRCHRIIDETPDVKTFCLVAEPPVLFQYQPGQFVNLAVEIDGQTVMRPYSISSSPTRPSYLSLTVKRVSCPPDQPHLPPGLVSNWLHDHFSEGDRVRLVGGPLGQFTCLPNLPSKLLLISAGSGITPMMSIARWLQDTLAGCDVVFLHSARTQTDLVFHHELAMMSAQMPNFRLVLTLTQATPLLSGRKPPGQPWLGLTGRLSPEMLRLVVPDWLERSAFVCGPTPFMQNARAVLESLNFPMQNYQEESFGDRHRTASPTAFQSPFVLESPASFATSSSGVERKETDSIRKAIATSIQSTVNSKAVITFIQSRQTVPVDPSSSILELAEQAGVPVTSGCRAGACGLCKVRTRGGQVRYDSPPSGLSAADRQAGLALACVGYPTGALEIEA